MGRLLEIRPLLGTRRLLGMGHLLGTGRLLGTRRILGTRRQSGLQRSMSNLLIEQLELQTLSKVIDGFPEKKCLIPR